MRVITEAESLPTEFLLNNIAGTAQMVLCEDEHSSSCESPFRKPCSKPAKLHPLHGASPDDAQKRLLMRPYN